MQFGALFIHSYVADAKRKEWTTGSMKSAVRAVKDKEMCSLKDVLVRALHSISCRI
jgi:hypothetical protein